MSLGALWLFDGLLQCQPIMFSGGFPRQILAPAAVGQPSFIAEPVRLIVDAVSTHPAIANSAFALIQILLGALLFTRRFSRPALAASIGWALSVWILGEGLGGLDTGMTILNGAPGAALLYGIVAVFAWPARGARSDDRPSWLALPTWSALWLLAAVLQCLDGNDSSMSLTMMLRTAHSSAPRWIAHIDHQLARLQPPSWLCAGLIALFVLVAIWALVPGWTRQFSLGIGVLISLASWLLFQGLGDLTSGQTTDPNAGPLIVLLAVSVVGAYAGKDEEDRVATAINESNPQATLETVSH